MPFLWINLWHDLSVTLQGMLENVMATLKAVQDIVFILVSIYMCAYVSSCSWTAVVCGGLGMEDAEHGVSSRLALVKELLE